MKPLATTSATVGAAVAPEECNTSAKPTENLEPAADSEAIVTELPLYEWLLVMATTAKRYEAAGGDISYEQHEDKFVINLHNVLYDEQKRALVFI